jgi:hypothetical protein
LRPPVAVVVLVVVVRDAVDALRVDVAAAFLVPAEVSLEAVPEFRVPDEALRVVVLLVVEDCRCASELVNSGPANAQTNIPPTTR